MKKRALLFKLIASLLVFSICFGGFLALLFGRNTIALAESPEQAASGTLNYSDGSIYEGEILYGRIRNGTGTFTWPSGETYTGNWENDSFTGKGEMTWPNLGTYSGEFSNGKRDGTGTFTWAYSGDPEEGKPVSYEGSWTADQIGPSGKLTLAGIGTYEGEFTKNTRNGIGEFTWLNGDKYSGSWSNDVISGEGTLTLADGTVFEGNFMKGELKNGTVTYAVSGGKAVRDIQNGKVKDTATIIYDDGTSVTGKLKDKEFTGNVTIKYPSGDVYVGSMRAGVKNGKGTYTWASGAHYIGNWENDKMSGTGKYFYGKDESMLYLSGTFKDGLPSGKLIYISDNKLKYETTWSNGSCTNIVYKKK